MSQFTRRKFIGAGIGAATASAILPSASRAQTLQNKKRPNVLFLMVDDMRPQLNCYGHAQMVTPNIDRLAAQGTLFERDYCQQAVCAPSRISILAGVRPDTVGIYGLETTLVSKRPDLLSLPHLFKNNGYQTASFGKVYHHRHDDPDAWTRPYVWPTSKSVGRGYLSPENKKLVEETGEPRGPATECAAVPDADYDNGAITLAGIEALREMKDEPFFLSVGWLKPHLPFAAPQEYWDLYRRDAIKLPPNYAPPVGVPPVAMHNWSELRNYSDIPLRGPITDSKALELIHGYYAATSYTDAQIGLVLDELDRLGLSQNTIVVLCVDHGFSLGENGLWCKHSNFEKAVHTPLIVRAPGQQKAGGRTRALTESLDIYPTLCDLAGLEKPPHLEGQSFAPILKDPMQTVKTAAFSQYPRGGNENYVMGYSMRTDRYRFTRWGAQGTELYDHQNDAGETINIAGRAENAALVAMLEKQLVAAIPGAKV